VAVNAYLLITQKNGAFLKSENSVAVGSGFANPFPGRPSIDGAQNALFPVQSFSMGVDAPVTISSRGPGSGKPDFADLSVMRAIDVASPTLFIQLCTGRTFDFADLLLTTMNGDIETVFAAYGLGLVFTHAQQWSGSSDTPEESLSFAFGQFWTGYRVIDSQGRPGKWIVKGWDRVENKAL